MLCRAFFPLLIPSVPNITYEHCIYILLCAVKLESTYINLKLGFQDKEAIWEGVLTSSLQLLGFCGQARIWTQVLLSPTPAFYPWHGILYLFIYLLYIYTAVPYFDRRLVKHMN